ncbi:unnamed protein product [Effrenium voratum]|nr:unnamed protein product [Effrenium voratum]
MGPEQRGIKLFVGRLPREVSRQQLVGLFSRWQLLEVFLIEAGAGCAFVRLATLDQARHAVRELHEKPAPAHSLFTPLQVALAKGEAERLGIQDDGLARPEPHQLAMQAGMLPVKELVDLIKAGQRRSSGFKQKWLSFCEATGVKSTRPSKHPAGALAHFVGTARNVER